MDLATPAPPTSFPDRLREHLEKFVGERHIRTSPGHHAATAAYIEERLGAAGFEVRREPVLGPYGRGANIVATRSGERRPGRTWILGAHYDTVVGSPGADDNGIAVAAVLEAAALLSECRFEESVELVAWDLEEWQSLRAGSRLGSRAMAQAARRDGRDIGGVLALEMIGLCRRQPQSQRFPRGFSLVFPDAMRWVEARGRRGDFIASVGRPDAVHLQDAIARAAREVNLPFVPVEVSGVARLIPDFYRSDHAPFWSQGYPAVMITDTANFRNGHYHQPEDTPETLDYDFAAAVAGAAIRALMELAVCRT